MSLGLALLRALWLFLPVYVANMVPVGAARLLPRWSDAIDGGRRDARGQRLLGENKTWRGLVCGSLAAGLTACLLAALARGPFEGLDFGLSRTGWMGVGTFGSALGVAALAGDAAKSWLKRRVARPPGSAWFPFDQLDFVVGALLGIVLAAPLTGGWALTAYFGDWRVPLLFVLASPGLQWLSSVLAHAAGLKRSPW